MKVIILCGGLGTRLGELTRITPKPLISVAGRPFLTYVLDHLLTTSVDEIILAVSFQWQKVKQVIGNQWRGIKVSYSVEAEPLGTGGAIKQAMSQAGCTEALVINGDTLLEIDFSEFLYFIRKNDPDIVVALKMINDTGRFGRVDIDAAGRILSFCEKTVNCCGLINSGVYWVKNSVFSGVADSSFSFEKDVLSKQCATLNFFGLVTDSYFIDMGVPNDLVRAQHELFNKNTLNFV